MTIAISLVGTPAQVIAAARTHWQSLALVETTLDALEAGLSLNGTFAWSYADGVELHGHTNDVPAIVDIYCPDDQADLWSFPLASATTVAVQASRGALTVPVLGDVAIVAPKTPRYTLAGFVKPVVAPEAADYPEPAAWVQSEGAHDAYVVGIIVQHGPARWVNLTAANVWEPGVSGWREVVAAGYPAWVQPTGAHDAYPLGAFVTHAGRVWENTGSAANVWEPGVFGWVDRGAAT